MHSLLPRRHFHSSVKAVQHLQRQTHVLVLGALCRGGVHKTYEGSQVGCADRCGFPACAAVFVAGAFFTEH